MLLVLIFGTVAGLHISVLCYFVLGFWGMYNLLKRLDSSAKILAILLSYIWVFSGFSAAHLSVGHLTFAMYLLSPWFFLALLNIHKRRGWVWFGLLSGWLIEQSPHYVVIEMLLIGCAVVLYQIISLSLTRRLSFQKIIKPYLLSLLIILPLVSFKLLFVFQYSHEFPRITPPDAAVAAGLLLTSLSIRNVKELSKFHPVWGWYEYADYIGTVTMALFTYSFFAQLLRWKSFLAKYKVLACAILLAFLTAMGPFSVISPFAIFHHLPILNETRVPSRWICWVSFGIILFLVNLPKKPIIYFIVVLSCIDVFSANFSILTFNQPTYALPSSSKATFKEYAYYDYGKTSLPLLAATQSNIGQVYGYEPLLGLYDTNNLTALTNRCGLNQGCDFIQSHNAVVAYWSPQKIILHRTSAGLVIVDMNPGKDWLVNGKRIFKSDRVLELKQAFMIQDSSNVLTITFSPTL